ncbi:MAG: ABC transporter permease [Woeseiaceae bacterium]|nr:ABC transporter permease [Woeseiaceae bacterium]
MEIRPILSAMWRNKTGSVLIALQIAFTLAIVVNSMFMAQGRIDYMARPSGMDIDNIITVNSLGFGEAYDHNSTIQADLRLLNELPGVVAATSMSSIPMSGSGSASGFKASMDEDAPRENGNYFLVGPGAEDALGVNIIEGRGFTDLEIRDSDHELYDRFSPQIIITKAYADALFPDGGALGSFVYNSLNEPAEVVGIVEHQYGAWVSWDQLSNVMWMPAYTEGPATRYVIRAEPGQRDALVPIIEAELANSNRTRIIRNVRTMEETIERSYQGDNAIAWTLLVAVVLLLLITGLGIVGLASFTVRQRTKQIGTRRAIGARKIDIIRYFLTENWLMTTIGIVLGTVLTIGVNFTLASLFDIERLNYVYLIGGMFVLWGLGFLAAAEPSRRASNVSPAIATRTV